MLGLSLSSPAAASDKSQTSDMTSAPYGQAGTSAFYSQTGTGEKRSLWANTAKAVVKHTGADTRIRG